MKFKRKVMNLKGNTTVSLTSFPEFDQYPSRGTTIYRDSMVKEFELRDGVFSFSVKARIEVVYKRWYETYSLYGPEEDDILDYEFSIETISGTRTHEASGLDMKLSLLELEQLENFLQKNIIIEL